MPLPLLRDLHESYLRSAGGALLRPEPWETALEWATQPLHATSSLLEPADDDRFLAFDYLVDAAVRERDTRPVPDDTWRALIEWANPADLVDVVWEASLAGHLGYVRHALDRACTEHQYVAAAAFAGCLGDAGWEEEAAERLKQMAHYGDRPC